MAGTPNIEELRQRPGRKPFGARESRTLRMPSAHMHHYEELAHEAGYPSLNAYLVASLARAHELDVPDWARPPKPAPEGSVQDQLNYRVAG